jgi:hypothetical protein
MHFKKGKRNRNEKLIAIIAFVIEINFHPKRGSFLSVISEILLPFFVVCIYVYICARDEVGKVPFPYIVLIL